MLQALTDSLSIQRKFTTPYRPQVNGLTERFNRTMMGKLRNYVDEGHDDWEEMLDYIVFAYRGSVHESTLEKPYFILHLRDPVMLVDRMLQFGNGVQQVNNQYEFVKRNMSRLAKAYQLARENLGEARQRQKVQYDKRAKTRCFQIGDKVLKNVKMIPKGLSKKLLHKYTGPFRVVEILGDCNVKIRSQNQKEEVIHIDRLKPLFHSEIWGDEPGVEFYSPFRQIEPLEVVNDRSMTVLPEEVGGQEDRVARPQQSGERKQKLISAKRTIGLEDPVLEGEGVKTSGRIRPHTPVLPPRREGLRSRAILERTRNRQFDEDFVTDSDDDQ